MVSVDAKGIVMCPDALRDATRKAAARKETTFRTRLTTGEKANRKRVATLAAGCDAAPAPRRPHDVIAVPGGRSGRRQLRPGPKAQATWLTGSAGLDRVAGLSGPLLATATGGRLRQGHLWELVRLLLPAPRASRPGRRCRHTPCGTRRYAVAAYEAIPPAYAEHIGRQLMAALDMEAQGA